MLVGRPYFVLLLFVKLPEMTTTPKLLDWKLDFTYPQLNEQYEVEFNATIKRVTGYGNYIL